MNTKDLIRSPKSNVEFLSNVILTKQNVERINRTLEYLPTAKKGEILLDIGSYACMIPLFHNKDYKNIIAVTNVEWEEMNKNLENDNLRVIVKDMEKGRLPLKKESVDAVLLLEVLEHFSIDPMNCMVEINRVLKKNGILILTTPNAISKKIISRVLAGRNPIPEKFNGFNSDRHNRLYTPEEIKKLIKSSGLEVEKIKTFDVSNQYLVARLTACVCDLFNWTQGYRGDYILAKGVKKGKIIDRKPDWLYKDRERWKKGMV